MHPRWPSVIESAWDGRGLEGHLVLTPAIGRDVTPWKFALLKFQGLDLALCQAHIP